MARRSWATCDIVGNPGGSTYLGPFSTTSCMRSISWTRGFPCVHGGRFNSNLLPPALSASGRNVSAVVASARIDLLVGRNPADPDRRVLACVKNNLCGPQPTLGYRILQDNHGRPLIEWKGPVPVTADEIVRTDPSITSSSLAKAVEFLQTTLASRDRPRKEVCDLASAYGIAPRTLERARAEAKVLPYQAWENGRNVWYWRVGLAATLEEEDRLTPEWLKTFCAGQSEPPAKAAG
jgi:hypothetical protein